MMSPDVLSNNQSLPEILGRSRQISCRLSKRLRNTRNLSSLDAEEAEEILKDSATGDLRELAHAELR